ncbi:MAG: hypothetical protein L0229_17350 [Blastocatellia bacterium]|nr:hypothetical protein [Blastocatellia bacterium]
MMERPEIEKRRLQEVAKKYENKGYTVFVQPDSSQLPEFLSEYRPDILVKRENENIVIEVKSRGSLAQSSHLKDLAREIQQHPGWRFDLVMANPPEEEAYVEDARSLDKEDIIRNLKESDELIESNHKEAALLLSWATAEAALRLLASTEQIPLKRYDSLYLIKQLKTYGVISREEYDLFMRALNLRNAAAHGFKADGFDSDLVQTLKQTISQLLETIPETSLA